MCVGSRHSALVQDRGQLKGISSLSTMWVCGVELGWSGLTASTFMS